MHKKIYSYYYVGHILLSIGFGIIGFLFLLSIFSDIVLASSYKPLSTSYSAPTLQDTVTPTVTIQTRSPVYSFSLATLGYDERNLSSPSGNAQYAFRIPESWQIEEDGILNLDLSYNYNQLDSEELPSFFGELTIKLNNETLDIITIDEELDHEQLRLPLPTSILSDEERTQHSLELLFDASSLCELPHEANLIIHPNSSITLNYENRPLVPDLARYPSPFVQRAFEPDSVRFVIPEKPNSNDATSALAIAAKLGNLTNNRLIISTTTDIELSQILAPVNSILNEHLIIIGQPENNQLLSLINDKTDLPVSLHQQQLDLTTQGPGEVASGDSLTYLFTATNTLDQDITVTVINTFALSQSELVDCTPTCSIDTDNSIVWDNININRDEEINLSLTLKASDTLTGNTVENTITIIEADLGPVSAETFTASVTTNPTTSTKSNQNISITQKGSYFFMYNGRAVPKTDGVVQEILSPWSNSHAILIITGLDDEAVKKSSQAMSSETRFPGMSGAVALVQDAITPDTQEENVNISSNETTFAELGYPDRVVQGGGTSQQLDYFFEIPFGWELTDEASITLNFGHSQLIDYQNSSLTAFLNNQPVSGISFSDETAGSGQVIINLADAKIRSGQNRLTLVVDASLPGTCVDSSQSWVLIKDTSKLTLPHNSNGERLGLDFRTYPNPFNLNQNLTDLLFVMPAQSTASEWELALSLASSLGSSVEGISTMPIGILGGNELPENVSNYHVMAVGRPSRNELIQQVNSQLPQPFLPGTDQIDQRLENVTFRLPADTSLGYDQLLPSPWNEEKALLVVTGTTDQSLQWALEALRQSNLEGNLILVKEDRVNTLDTRDFTNAGVVVAAATAAATTISETVRVVTVTVTATPVPPSTSGTSTSSQTSNNFPSWLIPLAGVNGLIVITIIAYAIWQRIRARR